MAEEKKFADEKLTDEQLNGVAGGTYGEYKELRDLIFSYEILRNSDAKKLSRSGLEKWLKDNINVTADISTGFILNFSDDAGKTNTYRDNDRKKYISHGAVKEKVLEYLTNKHLQG
ncbi:MAG: hypothetical protein IJL14_02465 [Selenomonadaceae bacterium]|nr:hypothetical protein [Selenomonadaceae bacterium]